jgi:hypothetical protein
VHPPTGARSRIFSGTLAATWVLRYLPRLSARVRGVVLRRLGFSAVSTARTASYGDPNFVPSASLTAAAKAWRDKVADHIGPLLLTIVAGTSPLSANDAFPVDAKGNFNPKGPFCRIRITPGTANGSAAYLRLTLAHEVFHCFEFDFNPAYGNLGGWLLEGLADWVALYVTKVPYSNDAFLLDRYFASPYIPLFGRTYDAAGFWGHVQDTTGDLWSRVPSILRSSGNEAAFFAAGGETDQFLSTWASSQVRSSTGGGDWQMTSPVPWPSATQLPVAAIADDQDHLIDTVAPLATGHVKILAGPLVHIAVTGHGRLSAQHNYTDLGDAWFCLEKQGCKCPAGALGEVPANRPLEPGAVLALTGDPTDGATADIESHTLSEFCDGIFVQQGTPGSGTLTQIAHYDPGASCTIGAGDTLTVKVTPKGGELTITVPGFHNLPKRSDGARVFEFQSPRRGGPDAVLGGTDYSTGDFFQTDPGIQIPQGAGHLLKNGKDGFIAATLFSPSNPEHGRVVTGTFACTKAVK